MAEEGESLTLRDALLSAVEEHREQPDEPVSAEAPDQKSDRPRDETGKFARKPEVEGVIPDATIPEPAPVQRAPKPLSWKKEYEEHWNSLDPKLADYINQREREYATGVSTYKSEAERARSLQSAMEPFLPELQRHNIQPEQWISNLGRAHQTLALGSPEQKAHMFVQLARDYGVDIGNLTNLPPPQYQPPQPAFNPQFVRKEVMSVVEEIQAQNEIQRISADKTNYPHFDTVRETMAGLLQSGLAQDLPSAYQKAIRMNDDLWQSQQEAQKAQQDTERQRQQAEAAKQARAKVVSVKSATPSGQAASGEAKGRREALREALSSVGTGRV